MKRRSIRFSFRKLFLPLLILGGCASYEQFRYITEEFELPTRVFKADYNITWQAVKQLLVNAEIDAEDAEAGFIKTRPMDNTLEVNFTDSFGANDRVKAAKVKLVINVVRGYRASSEVTKVTVYKRQFIQPDFLTGFREVPSDGIFEKVFLYRLERIIWREGQLKKIEEVRAKEIEAENEL